MSNQTIYSGDQNGLGWDAGLKLRIMSSLGLNVKHAIHTADQFSRSPDDANNSAMVTHETYRLDGNVNRWTASLEAPTFMGRMPLHPSSFSDRGIDFSRIARFINRSLNETVGQLTQSDWLGLSLTDNSRVAHGIAVKEILPHLQKLRKPLRRNLLETVRQSQAQEATVSFDRFFSLTEYPQKSWPEATKTILEKALKTAGCNGYIEVTTSIDSFTCTSSIDASPFLSLFLAHYPAAINAYNEAIYGPGEKIKPLEHGDLPFFAVVRANNKLVRTELTYQENDTIQSVLTRAHEHGDVVAILGKAITHVIELLMIAPIVICEEGSAYIPKAAKFAQLFEDKTDIHLNLHNFHRLQLNALDALTNVATEFRLPDYLHEAFRTTWISGDDFGKNWRSVVEKAEAEAEELSDHNLATLLPTLQKYGLLSDQTLSILSELQTKRQECESQISKLFQTSKKEGLTDEDKKKAAMHARQQKKDLCQQHNLELLAQLEQTILDGIELERAQALRSRLVISNSLKYWNCRPFTYWVDAIPGWYESIQKRAQLVLDPFFSQKEE